MSNIPIGAYTFSDSYLRKLKKDELIEHYRTLEKNWFNEIGSSNIQIDNSKKLLKEEYNKAVDDFVNFINVYCLGCSYTDGKYTRVDVLKKVCDEKAKQLKGE